MICGGGGWGNIYTKNIHAIWTFDGRNNMRVYAKHWIRFDLRPISIKVCGGTWIMPTYTPWYDEFWTYKCYGRVGFLGLILFFEEKGLGEFRTLILDPTYSPLLLIRWGASLVFFFFFPPCNKPIWLVHHSKKNETMKAPQNRRFYFEKLEFLPFAPPM